MGKVIAEDDELLEFPDDLDEDDEATGVDDADELTLSEIEDGPEEIGLDVETLERDDALTGLDDEDDDVSAESALDDEPLELDTDLSEGEDEEGWTEGSEGAGAAWDDELPTDADEDEEDADDGGLEGVDDPLIDGIPDDDERSITIGGDEEEDEEDDDDALDRVELDLG